MLQDMTPKLRLYPCRVRTVFNQLKDADNIELTKAILDNRRWPPYRLEVELNARGISLSRKSIKRHRDLTCSCKDI